MVASIRSGSVRKTGKLEILLSNVLGPLQEKKVSVQGVSVDALIHLGIVYCTKIGCVPLTRFP